MPGLRRETKLRGVNLRPAEANPGDFWIDPPATLDEALVLAPDPVDLVTRLARASSRSDVHRSRRPNGDTDFSGEVPGQDRGIRLLLTSRNELTGAGVEQIRKVYKVAAAIEKELSTAMYLAPEERRKRIEAVCTRLEISRAEFNNILGHWTKF
jgi:hypothetical protein